MQSERNSEVVCLSQMRAIEGKAKEVGAALKALVDPSLKEPECLAYEVWQDLSNPNSYVVYERFTSPEALAAHLATDHVVAFMREIYETQIGSQWDLELKPLV